MRLWHKDLIFALPKQQLLGQWRECCLIAKNIAEKGTPNHLLVNPIMDYPLNHFTSYCRYVYSWMHQRGIQADIDKVKKWLPKRSYWFSSGCLPKEDLFPQWHTQKYFNQCLSNLEEKHDRGGIPDDEWAYLLKCISHQRFTKDSTARKTTA